MRSGVPGAHFRDVRAAAATRGRRGAAAQHEKKVEPQIVLYCGKLADDRYREPGIIPFQRLRASDNVRIVGAP